MKIRRGVCAMLSLPAAIGVLSAYVRPQAPEHDLVGIVKAWVTMPQPGDWQSLDRLPGIRWASMPPSSLKNCLPDGGCFARQGVATIAGRNVAIVASGARTMVFNLYFRNGGAPFGEAAVLGALNAAALTTTLTRCPVRGRAGSTNWYRLGGAKVAPSVFSVQPASARRTGEGFVISNGAELPQLQPAQLAMYSEQCEVGATQQPVATTLPHEALAQTFVTLLAPSAGGTTYDWKTLIALPTGITWTASAPARGDLSYRDDRNPYNSQGTLKLGGREFSVLASGSQTQVQTIYLDEMGLHPKGEHMLGVVYQKGVAVQLSRCGPLYTESTNNWYALTSASTRPAMIRQSIRYDGNQVQDTYALRLDGSLPARDPRDRNPGVNGCR
ncbi:MAG: hypothetical protein H7099_07170 [Gemmatimonadaceae bacterium]|nr:hypothetical protein [Gemmatimonadaceae bacterium]